jgi:hypothetical protein
MVTNPARRKTGLKLFQLKRSRQRKLHREVHQQKYQRYALDDEQDDETREPLKDMPAC